MTEERRRHSDAVIDEIQKIMSTMVVDIALIKNQQIANHKSIREAVDRNSERIIKLDHTIHGNGREGIVTKVALVEDIHEEFEKHVDSDRKMFIAMFGLLATIILGIAKVIFFP